MNIDTAFGGYVTSRGDKYYINRMLYGQDVIASHFTIYKDKIRQKLYYFILNTLKFLRLLQDSRLGQR